MSIPPVGATERQFRSQQWAKGPVSTRAGQCHSDTWIPSRDVSTRRISSLFFMNRPHKRWCGRTRAVVTAQLQRSAVQWFWFRSMKVSGGMLAMPGSDMRQFWAMIQVLLVPFCLCIMWGRAMLANGGPRCTCRGHDAICRFFCEAGVVITRSSRRVAREQPPVCDGGQWRDLGVPLQATARAMPHTQTRPYQRDL